MEEARNGRIPFQGNNPIWRQIQYIEPSITHKPEVGGRCNGDAGIEEGRILDGAPVEALGAEPEHDCQLTRKTGEARSSRHGNARKMIISYCSQTRRHQ